MAIALTPATDQSKHQAGSLAWPKPKTLRNWDAIAVAVVSGCLWVYASVFVNLHLGLRDI